MTKSTTAALVDIEGLERSRGSWSAVLAGLAAIALSFGGGGAEGPINNGIIQSLSALTLIALLCACATRRVIPRRGASVALGLVALLALIAAFQLMPLPTSLWRSLPGRDVAVSAIELTAATAAWRPLSLDPEATRRTLAALIVPGAFVMAALCASLPQIKLLFRTVVGVAIVSSLIGALQLALSYPDWLTFYAGPNSGSASGVFANSNHHAAFLSTAIVCVGALVKLSRISLSEILAEGRPQAHVPRSRYSALWLLVTIFSVMVVATGSRSGLLLMCIALPAAFIIGSDRRKPLHLAGSLAMVLALIAVVAIFSPAGNDLAFGQSFLFTGDRRHGLLSELVYVLQAQWPWGSGFGTFVPVFAAYEDLDSLTRAYVNHAHNDVLELLIEAGAAGGLWLCLALAAVVIRVIRHVRSTGTESSRALFWSGAVILVLLGAQSLVDYPVRTAAGGALAGFAAALFFGDWNDERPARLSSAKVRFWIVVPAAVLALGLVVQIMRIQLAQAASRAGDGPSSIAIRSQNASGLALAAEQRLREDKVAEARSLALRSIQQAPISPRAVRVLAIAQDLTQKSGAQAWRVASSMGWRDGPTQIWAMQQALANKEFQTAALRADALLRTTGDQRSLALVRSLARLEPFRIALVERMLLDPSWVKRFFNAPASVDEQQLEGVLLAFQTFARRSPELAAGVASAPLHALIARGRFREAVALHQQVTGTTALREFDLSAASATERYGREATPFEWIARSRNGVIASVEQLPARSVLSIQSNGRQRYQGLRRYVALEPGTYRLRYNVRFFEGATDAFELVASCADGGALSGQRVAPDEGGNQSRTREFQVPDSCVLLLLAIEAKESDEPAAAEFYGLSLQKL